MSACRLPPGPRRRTVAVLGRAPGVDRVRESSVEGNNCDAIRRGDRATPRNPLSGVRCRVRITRRRLQGGSGARAGPPVRRREVPSRIRGRDPRRGQPGERHRGHHCRPRRPAGRRHRGRRSHPRTGRVGTRDPGRAIQRPHRPRRRDERARRGVRPGRDGPGGQADQAHARVRRPRLDRQRVLLRRRRAQPRGQGVGRVQRRAHLRDPPRAGGCRRLHRAVELPAADGGVEGAPRDRRREHDRAQACRADSAHLAHARRGLHQGGTARRRRQRPHGSRPSRRRGARVTPGRSHDVVHRLDPGRPADHGARRRHREARAPRARRQGAVRRLR